MPDPSGAGAQPSGDAIASRLAADNHSAIGAGSISRPLAIIWLGADVAVGIRAADGREQKSEPGATLPQIAVSSAMRVSHGG